MKHNPIGVFDSGVGGLTVVSAINKLLPQESIVYVGDTARVPYGNRDISTITEFALNIVKILEKKQVKLIVVACNTMSAVCLEQIKQASSIPVIDVISPTVEKIVSNNSNAIGVIGTKATVKSGAYEKLIYQNLPKSSIYTLATPLLVPIIEEGMASHHISKSIILYYYNQLKKYSLDTIVLGCTHYPLIKQELKNVVGSSISIIDSAGPTASAVKQYLSKTELDMNNKPNFDLLFTDMSTHVLEAVRYIFGTHNNTTISEI